MAKCWPTDLGFGDEVVMVVRDTVVSATPDKLETDEYVFDDEDEPTLIAVVKV